MQFNIGNPNYVLVSNPIEDEKNRAEYFALTKEIFGLDFSIWYNSGFWGENFTPYTLFHKDKAVASVGVYICDVVWNGRLRKFAQISTVMTDKNYRKKGLNQSLLELAIKEWGDKSDCIYLYANDSVVDYYPKFGFKKSAEYRYKKDNCGKKRSYRKLDLKSKNDVDLLHKKYNCSNPYALLTMKNNFDLLMFHCLTFLSGDIYYLEQYDAVVIAKYEGHTFLCYDIYTDSNCHMEEIIAVLVEGNIQTVVLGFTPKVADGFCAEEVQEEDYHVFVLKDNVGIFGCNKVALPLLSHA